MTPRNLGGLRFGRLIVLSLSHTKRLPCGKLAHYWLCECDCGQRRKVSSANLYSGQQSCGCLNTEMVIAAHKTHGMKHSPEYNSWRSMIGRCRNPNATGYQRYGGVGITVCDRWKQFENFYADMGPRPSLKHSIERLDGAHGYEPSNCAWATRKEQANNRRTNLRLIFNGRCLTSSQWSDVTGIPRNAIVKRINQQGWTVRMTLTTPSRVGA